MRLLHEAIALDPSYAVAYAFAARCHQVQLLMGWVPPHHPSAAELGRNDSEALWMAGLALVQIVGEIDYGSSLIDRSLVLNPNSSNAWTSSSLARIYLGDLERATDHFRRSQRLNPLDQLQHVHWNIVGLAHFAAGRFEDAAGAADKALKVRLRYPPGLRLKVATCGLLGQIEEGRSPAAPAGSAP